MKEQKTISTLIFLLGLCSLVFFTGIARADYGGATVHWVASTDNVGVTGYRVYYRDHASPIDCTAWDGTASQDARRADNGTLLPSTYRTVDGGSTTSFTFSNTTYLTPGVTYDFAVVAYDAAGNLSNCATGTGAVNGAVNKAVSYAADLNNSGDVNGGDFSLFRIDYGQATFLYQSDFNNDGLVNGGDFSLFRQDYGKPF